MNFKRDYERLTTIEERIGLLRTEADRLEAEAPEDVPEHWERLNGECWYRSVGLFALTVTSEGYCASLIDRSISNDEGDWTRNAGSAEGELVNACVGALKELGYKP